jgi:diguanylate cyclase (GGDEF)-like protein/PAS domain S-box-containing protein
MRNARSMLAWGMPAVLAVGAVAAAAVTVPSVAFGGTGLYADVLVLAVSASAWGWWRSSVAEHLAWLCTSMAVAGTLAANVGVRQFPAASAGPLNVVDGLFLGAALSLALAAALLGRVRGDAQTRLASMDAGILTGVGIVVVWDAGAATALADPSLDATTTAVAVIYPVVCVVTLGLVVRLLLSRYGFDRSTSFFAAGAALTTVANLALNRLPDGATVGPGTAAGAAWLTGSLLLGFAALQSSDRWASRSLQWAAMGRTRLGFVLAAVLVPLLVVGQDLMRRDLVGLNTLTIALAVAICVTGVAGVRLLRSLDARLTALILHSADAILVVDQDHRITFASPAAEEFWGCERETLVGSSIVASFTADSREPLERQLDNVFGRSRGATVRLDGRIVDPNRQVRLVEGIARNLLDDEVVRGIVVTLRDVTARHELEQQLERGAFHDGLTGLANRTLFVDRLEHALARSARTLHAGVAVLFIDLDDFKAVNDGLGHSAGDEMIRSVAERLRRCVRPGDTVARLGGDEFTVLVDDILSTDDVAALAERLLQVLQLPVEVGGTSLTVPASVGVAIATADSTAEALLRDADIAMYRAKSEGKSRVVLFDETLRQVAVQRLNLKVDLAEALRSEQFELVYQPIVDTRGGDLRGFEALLRWHHPKRGLVSPGEFVPAAEETGIIVDIGRWALETACRQAVDWNRRWPDPLGVSVNMSALQLHQPGFADELRYALVRSDLDPSLLTVELTESVLAKHQHVASVLTQLRAFGVGVAIDDFGTGYSSLSYLQKFPLTSLKVDQSFIAGLSADSDNSLVRSILSIGRSFGLITVAEGIETPEQLELIARLGCDRAQGFLIGRPQSAGQIDGMLEIERMQRTQASGRHIANKHRALHHS